MRNSARAALLSGALLLTSTGQAQGATTIGETFAVGATGCSPDYTHLQSASPGNRYSAPSRGVITSWSYQAGQTTQQIRFKVARPVGGNDFLSVGESAVTAFAANQLATHPVRIPVQAGDVIGFYISGSQGVGCGFRNMLGGYRSHHRQGDPAPGNTFTFEGPFGSDDGGANQYSLAATLEPDCDGDGLADETEDLDTSSCDPPPPTVTDPYAQRPDTDPPETRITKDAPRKTDKSTVKFKFRSDEQGATFECKIDKRIFKPCASPKLVKRLDEGKHKFQVRAIDAAGNRDPTPDKDKFKVVD